MLERNAKSGRLTSTLVAVCAVLASGCSDRGIPPLEEPVLEGVAPAVRQQLRSAWERAKAAPVDAAVVGALGRALYAYGQYQAAAQCFDRSRVLDSQEFEWVYLLGVTQTDLGQTEEARDALRAALALRPDDLPAALRLADAIEQSGDADRSQEILEAALRRSPRSAAVHYRLGRLTASKSPQGALDHLEKAVGLEPGYREAHYALANAYRAMGRDEDAAAQLAMYSQADATARRHYADPLIEAMDSIRASSAQASFDEGHALGAQGDLEGARSAYQATLEIDPGYAQAHVNLIAVYGELGNQGLATEHYNRAVGLNPSIAEAHYNYGVALHFAENYQGAADAFAKALDVNPQDANAHANLATTLERLGRAGEASRHFRLALEHNPSQPMANYHTGRRLADAGRFREALPYLETAVANESSGTALHAFVLALVYRRLGRADDARNSARNALALARAQGHADLAAEIVEQLDP